MRIEIRTEPPTRRVQGWVTSRVGALGTFGANTWYSVLVGLMGMDEMVWWGDHSTVSGAYLAM